MDPPTRSFDNNEILERRRKIEAIRRGEAFVDAILNTPFQTLPETEGMRVWCNIPSLRTGEEADIVLRSITEPFWQSCIDAVHNPRHRVCAVGTPGVGKTHTTPLLLRLLLLQQQTDKTTTVVYLARTEEMDSWYYEFQPPSSDDILQHKNKIKVTVYPEHTKKSHIESLHSSSTYYVVDPGCTQTSCNPPEGFPAKVIIISSPNDQHWGGSSFIKLVEGQMGVFRYFPLWTLPELLHGSTYCSLPSGNTFSKQKIAERYRLVGGVPRNVFLSEEEIELILTEQGNAINVLTEKQAQLIATGKLTAVGLLDGKLPKSSVIGIELGNDDLGAFTKKKVVPISSAVAEQVFTSHIKALWNSMVDQENTLVFEVYTRTILTRHGQEIIINTPSERGQRSNPRPNEITPTQIGGYKSVRVSSENLVLAAISDTSCNVIYFSSDPCYPLIDFVCKTSSGNIEAFQVTTSLRHTADETAIAKLEDDVGDRGLTLYFLYPSSRRSGRFATIPARPKTRFCRIYHVEVPNPNFESS